MATQPTDEDNIEMWKIKRVCLVYWCSALPLSGCCIVYKRDARFCAVD